MRNAKSLLPVLAALFGTVSGAVRAEAPQDTAPPGPVYVLAHYDVLPRSVGGVDFLKTGYDLLFRYRDQSGSDAGLTSFRILDLVPPTTNHSEVIQTWDSYEHYRSHLAQEHTTRFRFEVQNNPRVGGICCIGSPIDDRQYRLVRAFRTPWPSTTLPATVGPSGPLYVISYVEFLPQANAAQQQEPLLRYAESANKAAGTGLLSYTILRELHRSNRYALLEVWASRASYDTWQSADTTRNFTSILRPLLEAPVDHRYTSLCGKTFTGAAGCIAP